MATKLPVHENLKVAIVGQHLDGFFAPSETSVGICTRGLAEALAGTCSVRVYGMADGFRRARRASLHDVEYRILPKPALDTALFQVLKRAGSMTRFVNRGMEMPITTSALAYPKYGALVAEDIVRDPVDVILIQHNARRLDPIKRLNPATPVILHFHAKLLPQELTARYRRDLARAEAVSGVSRFIVEDLRQRLGRDAFLIRNGVDHALADTGPAVERSVKKRILYVGAVSPEKGLHDLIAAFNLVHERLEEVELDIIGGGARPFSAVFPLSDDPFIPALRPYFEGDYTGMLRALANPEALSGIRFLGPVASRDEVSRHMSAARVLAFPSLCDEGFGLPPAEAMALGTPAVVTEAGGLAELIRDGVDGRVVPKADVPGLADALTDLLRDDGRWAEIASQARRTVRNRYTWQAAADDFLALANRLLRAN
jgi:glycosyltransferase involved in cell wall biosynthesis